MPETDWIDDATVIETLRRAAADTRHVAQGERAGERIDGDTMEFNCKRGTE